MELKEAIDKLFEMTDEQRLEVFNIKEVGEILDSYLMEIIISRIENFCSEPKYGDIYLDRNGNKVIILDCNFILHEKYKCPQSMPSNYVNETFVKTGKNVADELKELFK